MLLSDSFILLLHDETNRYTQLNRYIPADMRQYIDANTPPLSPDGVEIIDDYTVHADFYMADGTVINPKIGGAEGGYMAYQFDGFINPQDIQRVTFKDKPFGG